jgi:hypothetical protein
MTWIVTCPDWQNEKHKNTVQSWTLSVEELNRIKQDFFEERINCKVCSKSFSLQQGVKESFSIDNPFTIHDFQFNSEERGGIDVKVGQLAKVEFQKPFEDKPVIYLTPYLKSVSVVSGFVNNNNFSVFSFYPNAEGEGRQISWCAYGNRSQKGVPIWRKLLSSSKTYQLSKDFQSEIVYLESAFEVYIAEFIGERLKQRLRTETIDWILGHGITEVLRIGFIELWGKQLSKMEPKAYANWEKNVRNLRNSVIHRGEPVNADQASKARAATFEIITRINPFALNYFRIQRVC